MSLRDVIENFDGRLTAADRRVVQTLLTNPTECAFLSVGNLAVKANVHTTTAVRFAQKLGFAGYPELRATLQNEVMQETGAAERRRRRLSDVGQSDIVADLVGREVETLNRLPAQTDQRQLRAGAEALMKARQIYLFGLGHSRSLVGLFAGHLRRHGLIVTTLTHPDRDTAERLNSISPQDVVLAFSVRVVARGLKALLSLAKDAGAKSILISDDIGPLVRPNPDFLLAASRGGHGTESQSMTVPMAIGNALILMLSSLDEERTMTALDRCDRLIKTFDSTTETETGGDPWV
ncbi:MAG: MurR/RpiR family transcriptional regulator [Rhodospirillales bacterium]